MEAHDYPDYLPELIARFDRAKTLHDRIDSTPLGLRSTAYLCLETAISSLKRAGDEVLVDTLEPVATMLVASHAAHGTQRRETFEAYWAAVQAMRDAHIDCAEQLEQYKVDSEDEPSIFDAICRVQNWLDEEEKRDNVPMEHYL